MSGLIIKTEFLFKPWLWFPSKWTYKLSPYVLKIYSFLFSVSFSGSSYKWKSLTWRDFYFPNPLGTAGGIDKNALNIKHWQKLGAGFCEIGTVTPEPQTANPGKILDRHLKHYSLWNNMGFPNKGLSFVREKLTEIKASKIATPLFINIGKNRNTSIEQALEDYKKCIVGFYEFADIFVINISSPNTKNLRSLSNEQTLPGFLKSLKQTSQVLYEETGRQTPMLLKLSPDETDQDFLRIIDQSLEAGIDGWCISNSSSQRSIKGLFPEHGGVSGRLVKKQSLYFLKLLKSHLDKKNIEDKLIVSCGGVFNAEDILNRLQAGAHLIQVYSALVFKGPGFFKSISKKMTKIQR